MHIALDVSQIAYTHTGVGRFTSGLTHTLLTSKYIDAYTFFFSGLRQSPPSSLTSSTIKRQLHRWYLSPPMLHTLWNMCPFASVTPVPGPYDWFISSDWTQPPPHVAKKRATIVHDLVFRIYPETVNHTILQAQTARLERVATECDLVITDSEQTAADFAHYYPHFRGKIQTIYPGVVPLSFDPHTSLPADIYKNEFFLFVGKAEPRKNIPTLIESFIGFKKANPHLPHKLLIVGPRGWGNIVISPHPAVVHLGEVSDLQLATLYTHATALVAPSLYEGFGYPVVEAMHLGCPVIASHTSSLSELISPDKGMGVDPRDSQSITNALTTLARDPQKRELFINKGKVHAASFTWSSYIDKLHLLLSAES